MKTGIFSTDQSHVNGFYLLIPAEGRKISILVYLGSLTLPQSFIDNISSKHEEAIKTGIFREVYIHCDTWDSVRHK